MDELVDWRSVRTIPTHVGRTLSTTVIPTPGPDHPHARGENARALGISILDPGPSPRTWGEQPARARMTNRFRTIPTHVGRTTRVGNRTRNLADHPHARGENLRIGLPVASRRGPSPRTWGEPDRSLLAPCE